MAIVLDQLLGASTTGDGTTTPSFVTTQPVAVGGFIVVTIGWFTQGTLSSVSGGGLSWTVDKTGFPAGGPASDCVGIASAQAPAGLASGTTITFTTSVTTSGPTQGGISFTGVKTSSPVDGTPLGATGVTPAAAGWSSGNYAITAGSVIVATCWAETAAATNTPTAPSLEIYDAPAGIGGWGACSEYRIEAAAGSYAVAGTWSVNQQSANCAVAYLAGPSGPAPDTTTRSYQIRRSRMTSW